MTSRSFLYLLSTILRLPMSTVQVFQAQEKKLRKMKHFYLFLLYFFFFLNMFVAHFRKRNFLIHIKKVYLFTSCVNCFRFIKSGSIICEFFLLFCLADLFQSINITTGIKWFCSFLKKKPECV